MGLHLTPQVLRRGWPLMLVFLTAGALAFGLQLLVVLPLAALRPHVLPSAIVAGPLSLVGAPYDLNPPAQVPPVAALLDVAFADPQGAARGQMMLGILAGSVVTTIVGSRLARRAERDPPQPAAAQRQAADMPLWQMAHRYMTLLTLILLLVALAFALQRALLARFPDLRDDHVPVIVLAYLLAGLFRAGFELIAGAVSLLAGWRFPEQALTVLLLGPTMGFVLTYAVMSVPLHTLAHVELWMLPAALLGVATSAAVSMAMFPLLARMTDRYTPP